MKALLRLPVSRIATIQANVNHATLQCFLRREHSRCCRSSTTRHRKTWRVVAAATQDDQNTIEDDSSIPTQEEYISHCQEHYTIPGLVQITPGAGGLPFVTLKHPNGALAQICLHGAAITSWKRTDGTESLFLRDGNKFDGIQPIAGGIGLAWPQIGPGALPVHGLLKSLHWSIVETSIYEDAEDPAPSVSFYLESIPGEEGSWSHAFEAVYSVTLQAQPPPRKHPQEEAMEFERMLDSLSGSGVGGKSYNSPHNSNDPSDSDPDSDATTDTNTTTTTTTSGSNTSNSSNSINNDSGGGGNQYQHNEEQVPPPSVLKCRLDIHNLSSEEFKFTAGLLTHFATENIRENINFVKVLGLGGKYVLDYATDPMRPGLAVENNDFVFFNPDSGKNVDKLYVDCEKTGEVLFCPGTQSYVDIKNEKGFTDMEILHPAASAPDVAQQCVCVACARKARPVTLQAGERWTGEMMLTAHNRYWELPEFEKNNPYTIPVPKREEAVPATASAGEHAASKIEQEYGFSYDESSL